MIVAYLYDAEQARQVAAAAEEEGVPLRAATRPGRAVTLARAAAVESGLGIGIGADAERLVIVLAAWPGTAFLAAPPTQARALGHCAARIAARRPLTRGV